MSKIATDPKQTLYLVDISSFIFRAFFAIRNLRNRAGEPTNAVYGVATMLARLAEEAQPEYLAVAYDSKEPSFRHEIYEDYKANRSEAPEDLVPQFDRIEALIESFDIHSYRLPGVEADDLIATLARRWCAASPQHQVVIVSGDKDLMQLVNDRVRIWDTMKDQVYEAPQVEEKFGVRPDQIRDYLALVGDSSDNIPGVTGIGPKGASDLLREFGNLEGILGAAQAGKIPGKKGALLVKEEKEARLSAELATVKEDLELEIPLESLSYHFHVTPRCIRLLEELEFHTLIAKWKDAHTQSNIPPKREEETSALGVGIVVEEAGGEVKTPSTDSRFRLVNSENEFQALLQQMEKKKAFGFDLETTSLNPREAELVGVAICVDPQFGCYIPVGHRGTDVPQLPLGWVLERLKPFLEDSRYSKIGQNLKYDWSVLRELGLNPQGIGADTMVAGYLLDPEDRHNLKTLSARYLNYNVLTYEEVCGKGKDALGFDCVDVRVATRYSAEDAWLAIQLWNRLEPLLKAENMMNLYTQVDLPLVQILSKMELQGVCIDVGWLQKLSEEFGRELREIEERIQAFTAGPVNLNSPKQLAQLLFHTLNLPTQGKTKTGFSTDAKVLEALAPLHEVPRLLLEYREIAKLKGTYVDPLPQLRDRKTGKIHTSFHQTVTATGRLSSSEPNLQNIPIRTPRGTKIRRAFIPSPGNLLMSADYSQIELRLLAHMSGDSELVGAFQRGEDVHRRTAGEIFGVSPEQVDDRQRGIAKAINFGLMYGKTVFGLSEELKIPRKEAKDMIERYFNRYRDVRAFLDRQVADAKEHGFVTSLMGRKRKLPDIRSRNGAVRGFAERMAMNSPIQGTAADLIKLAMIEIDRRLEEGGYASRLTIQVHDEVVLDCPKAEVEEVKKLVVDSMENAMKLSVPLRANAEVGEDWMSL